MVATYKEIQAHVKEKHGFVPRTCWIAHVKEMSGIPVKKAHNRIGDRRVPVPPNKVSQIQEALVYFGLVNAEAVEEIGKAR